jgi:hypothetical protein
MENFFYFLVIGGTIVFLILWFDKQQRRKVKKVLKETKNVQPLFLLKSTEEKLSMLNAILYGHPSREVHVANPINLTESARQMLSAQLGSCIQDYNGGKITLKAYHNALKGLLYTAHELTNMTFERLPMSNQAAVSY